MKAILVIEMPNEYAERYNVNEMYVWNLVVQDKQGYAMLDLITDKPSHLRPLPEMVKVSDDAYVSDYLDFDLGWNACIKAITGEENG